MSQNISDALLRLLQENLGKAVLETELLKQFNLSANSLDKQIKGLRQRGYLIEEAGDQSYVLKHLPDCLEPKEILAHLKTNFIGHDLHYFNEVPSEIATAYRLAQQYPEGQESITPLRLSPRLPAPDKQAYAGNGSVIVTEVATHESLLWDVTSSGLNLHSAVVLRPGILPVRAPQIVLVAYVALARVIENMSGAKPAFRWPKALVVQNKAVARINVTMESNIDRINFLILGFEVNLNGFPEDLSLPLSGQVTSLRHLSGKPINRAAFAASLYRELEKWYVTYINKGPEKIVREVNQFCRGDLKGIEIVDGNRTYCGLIEGFDAEGGLLLRSTAGQVQRIALQNFAHVP